MSRKVTDTEPADLDALPLDMSRPANEQIAAALKSAILSMQLAPGQMISEKEIGQLFGASRTPVREAFALLREESLIVTWPSRGTFVTRLSVNQIKGAQFLREAMEVAVVARLCTEGLPEAAQTELRSNLARQRRAIDSADKSAFQDLDDLFHVTLADCTGMDRVRAALVREKAVLDRLRVLSLDLAANMDQLHEGHAAILAAIQARNGDEAVALLRRHLRLVLDTLSSLVANNREFFDLAET